MGTCPLVWFFSWNQLMNCSIACYFFLYFEVLQLIPLFTISHMVSSEGNFANCPVAAVKKQELRQGKLLSLPATIARNGMNKNQTSKSCGFWKQDGKVILFCLFFFVLLFLVIFFLVAGQFCLVTMSVYVSVFFFFFRFVCSLSLHSLGRRIWVQANLKYEEGYKSW